MENKVVIYTANDGKTKIDVKLEEETLWLTQAQMCELYQSSKSNVSEHIKHIFEEGELNEESVVRKFRTTAAEKGYMNPPLTDEQKENNRRKCPRKYLTLLIESRTIRQKIFPS